MQQGGDFFDLRLLLQFRQARLPSRRQASERGRGLGYGEILQHRGDFGEFGHCGIRLLGKDGLAPEENRSRLVKLDQLGLQDDQLRLRPHKLVVGTFHLVRDDTDGAIQFLLCLLCLAIQRGKKPCPVFGLRAARLHAHVHAALEILRGDLDIFEHHAVGEEKLTKRIRIRKLARRAGPTRNLLGMGAVASHISAPDGPRRRCLGVEGGKRNRHLHDPGILFPRRLAFPGDMESLRIGIHRGLLERSQRVDPKNHERAHLAFGSQKNLQHIILPHAAVAFGDIGLHLVHLRLLKPRGDVEILLVVAETQRRLLRGHLGILIHKRPGRRQVAPAGIIQLAIDDRSGLDRLHRIARRLGQRGCSR